MSYLVHYRNVTLDALFNECAVFIDTFYRHLLSSEKKGNVLHYWGEEVWLARDYSSPTSKRPCLWVRGPAGTGMRRGLRRSSEAGSSNAVRSKSPWGRQGGLKVGLAIEGEIHFLVSASSGGDCSTYFPADIKAWTFFP